MAKAPSTPSPAWFFFFQAEDGIRDLTVTGVQTVCSSDLLQYEYGIWPLRGVFRRTVVLPSVLEHGVGQYLAEIAAVQARHQGVLLIPGIEVAPHYYWTDRKSVV